MISSEITRNKKSPYSTANTARGKRKPLPNNPTSRKYHNS
nr:MAG TPA: hypothetical protein [Caudoviricetes sp.]